MKRFLLQLAQLILLLTIFSFPIFIVLNISYPSLKFAPELITQYFAQNIVSALVITLREFLQEKRKQKATKDIIKTNADLIIERLSRLTPNISDHKRAEIWTEIQIPCKENIKEIGELINKIDDLELEFRIEIMRDLNRIQENIDLKNGYQESINSLLKIISNIGNI